MISKILQVDDFGILDNFKWDNNNTEFKKTNVIYGWNYSGKTTLSRVFRNYELGQKHPDYPSCSSTILTTDGSQYDCNGFGCPYPIKVFNTDFINENIKWDDQIQPILLIGEENIKLQEELKELRDEKTEKHKVVENVSSNIAKIETDIENQITDKARVIKTTLAEPNYTKRNLSPVIQQIVDKPLTLDEETLKSDIDTYRSTDKKPEIASITLPVPEFDELRLRVSDLLQTQVVSKTIERLQKDPVLNSWVRQGKDLHVAEDTCKFCGNKLPEGLIDQLNAHFSDEYEKQVQTIDNLINELKTKELTYEFPDKARFYAEFIPDYSNLTEQLKTDIKNFNAELSVLSDALAEKRKNPFVALQLKAPKSSLPDLPHKISEINGVINKHNSKSASFDSAKQAAFKRVEKHFASEFVVESEYVILLQSISNLKKDIEGLNKNISEIEKRCAEIEQKLSETVKGANKVNQYLKSYFGRTDISLKVTPEDTFELYRGGKSAKNLSEGEKTAISFAYFITKVEEKGSDTSKSIVYVDDPVSSLDSNHLFSTYSFVKNKLSNAHQLFISTHNYELFNLLKDWLTRKKIGTTRLHFTGSKDAKRMENVLLVCQIYRKCSKNLSLSIITCSRYSTISIITPL